MKERTPSDAYWREVRALDDELAEAGEQKRSWLAGIIPVRSSRAEWEGESGPDEEVHWGKEQILGRLSVSSNLIVVSKSYGDDDRYDGGLFTHYDYVPDPRLGHDLKVYRSVVLPEDTPQVLDARYRSHREQDKLGLSEGEEDDHEQLLYELRRGVQLIGQPEDGIGDERY